MPLRSDIWRIGLVAAPIEAIAAQGAVPGEKVCWLPEEPSFRFLADPFGLWRDSRLHLFAEAYDYRTRRGVIDLLEIGPDLAPTRRRTVLREPWHLSYPQVFEADGETWMAPEAHRSGALTLYRAARFPDVWEAAVRLELDTPAVDSTVFRHSDLWWIAYAPSGRQSFKQGRLHLAYAERLQGPWRTHPQNPVRIDRASSRPAGAPFLCGGELMLPVQDCTRTYGGGVRLLRIRQLTPERFEAEASQALIGPPPEAGAYRDGLHTLSGCGPLTLIDVKRIDRSLGGLAIELQRGLRRA
jgi:hypothetical protein